MVVDDRNDARPGEEYETAAVTNSVAEAELIVGKLASEGIEAFVAARDGGGQFPNLDALGGVAVLVHGDDLERAREVLDHMEPLAENEAEPPTT